MHRVHVCTTRIRWSPPRMNESPWLSFSRGVPLPRSQVRRPSEITSPGFVVVPLLLSSFFFIFASREFCLKQATRGEHRKRRESYRAVFFRRRNRGVSEKKKERE